MENTNQMLEVLDRLERSNRRQVFYARMQCLFSVIAAVCCAALLLLVITVLPQIREITGQVQDMVLQAQTILTNLETVTTDLAEADLAGMVASVNTLVTNSQDGIVRALETINELDIEALNQAIANLAEVVEPLAKFFQAFR